MRLSKPLLLNCPPHHLHEVPLLQTEFVVGDRVLAGICECQSDDGERQHQAFPDDGLGGGVQILPSGKHRHERTRCMYTMNKNARQLGRRPDKQGPRPQPRYRGWVDKSATGTKPARMKIATHKIVIGTWNVQTLWQTGKLELLRNEMEKYQHDILGLSEIRWTQSGELNGGELIWSGEVSKHARGVGFLLSRRAKAALLGYRPVNHRIIVAKFRGSPMNINVVQVYAPTADSSEDIEAFYDRLEEVLSELPRKYVKIVTGDWNAKVGTDNRGLERSRNGKIRLWGKK